MRTLTVTNWTRWQSYRADRGQPPWIKLHRNILRNPEWGALTNAERGQLVQIWILAADKGGVIEVPDYVNMETFIKGVCCMNEDVDLEVLRRLGFISLDANVTPSRRQRDANVTPQSRVEERREEESSRARLGCEICGNTWPSEYGNTCHKCRQTPSTRTPPTHPPGPPVISNFAWTEDDQTAYTAAKADEASAAKVKKHGRRS